MQAQDLVRKMENSPHFKQTKITQQKTGLENARTGDRVEFEIEAAYTPWNSAQQVSGGMH